MPLYYEDTDLSGFVYHANYLKFCERAREHLIGIGYLRQLYEQGLHFVVSKANLHYRAPSRHGERLRIESEGHYSLSPAIEFTQNIYCLDTHDTPTLAVEAAITIVALNHQNRPQRLPHSMLERFSQLHSSLT